MLKISILFTKIISRIFSYTDILLWIKEFFVSLFDHRLRYFVYGLYSRYDGYIEDYYHLKFLPIAEKKLRLSIYNPHIRFYEVHSGQRTRKKIKKVPNKLTVFNTGECVHSSVVPNAKYYADNCISCTDISIGFDYITEANYIRFPFWLLRFFPPTDNKDKIAKLIREFNERRFGKTKFCSLVASHDITNIRTKMLKIINKIEPVMCPGKFSYNDTTLGSIFNDNKHEYLKQFKFNLCPENDIYVGYVTEKIFDALYADCIPIYWGGDRPPEPAVINEQAIILLNPEEPDDTFEQIQFLHTNEKAYSNFKKNHKFNDSAVDWIYTKMQDMFNIFEQKTKEKKLI